MRCRRTGSLSAFRDRAGRRSATASNISSPPTTDGFTESAPSASGSYSTAAPKHYRAGSRCEAIVETCRASFFKALDCSDQELYAKREYKFTDVPETLSRADILTNLVIHERGHHGDLNTLFHRLGIRSFVIDYRYFITRPGDFVVDDEEE